LQLTTYYPAPYGGYVSLLTTGNTFLARDTVNSTVSIGSLAGNNSAQLNVYGNVAANNSAGLLYNQAGEGETLRLTGSNGVKMHIENINGSFRLVNTAWSADIFNVNQNGDITVQGKISNLCEKRGFSKAAGRTDCGGSAAAGVNYTIVDITDTNGNIWYESDWNGEMDNGILLCCKMPN
jgi:hypothetical protein